MNGVGAVAEGEETVIYIYCIQAKFAGCREKKKKEQEIDQGEGG